MVDSEILFDYANNGLHVPTWEIIFYVAVMTLYAFIGRARSCLINSFAFTFYWGFMYLLPRAFAANGLSHTALIAYAVCGLGIYALTTLALQTRNEVKTR
ncbi:MAG: hypothetical protein HYV05_10210 [Deltaproteobacteria bacterium]|nr:hypothetical protein [Deltaproteobacteria bacterium]MBI2211914.1 hypothetical protein [Deltaproteobacteria bacterium]MBI2349010.1 hypothetical protein [Deltaproteobacteria bacterium]MBI2540039.1 hypothetical protein [Deltaproteobacteria bacterium]MBI2991758.1 hypothetical protein [Deltaproteobacteria bacterium]